VWRCSYSLSKVERSCQLSRICAFVLLNFGPEASLRRVAKNKATPSASRARTTTAGFFTRPANFAIILHEIAQRAKRGDAPNHENYVSIGFISEKPVFTDKFQRLNAGRANRKPVLQVARAWGLRAILCRPFTNRLPPPIEEFSCSPLIITRIAPFIACCWWP
jgi:hypothetical protein